MHVLQDEYDLFTAWTIKNNPQGKGEDKPKKAAGDKKGGKEAGAKKKK